jgi:hypothetical protein
LIIVVERGDRRERDIRERQARVVHDPAELALEPELELDVVRLPVRVVVDVEGVGDARVEVVVVRPRTRLFAWDHVHDQVDLVVLTRLGAAEHEEVRDVRGWVVRDQRGLTVARRLGGRRARPEAEHEQCDRRAQQHERDQPDTPPP